LIFRAKNEISSCGKSESMVDFVSKLSYDVDDLKKLIGILRSPQGCPWDREQTHKSIRRNLLEEAFEAAEAIDKGSTDELLEELGDVLMQVVFHADIADNAGLFTFNDIADTACKKLIRRHPHVFGSISAKDGDESLVMWEDIKRAENAAREHGKRLSDMTTEEFESFYHKHRLDKKLEK